MSTFDAFGYQGKRALVVGGATGMGAATAQLAQDAGAEVVIMDIAEPTLAGAKSIHVNLADKDSIDAAVDECGGPVHALFSCAGVADGTPGIEKINFIGHRHMIDRHAGRGHAAAWARPSASSPRPPASGGRPTCRASRSTWPRRTSTRPRRGSPRTAAPTTCPPSRPSAPTSSSQAFPMLKRGIRINAICPGPTDTPLAQANKEMWLGFGADYREALGIEASTPLEQAVPARLPVLATPPWP